MKKWISFLLLFSLGFTLSACKPANSGQWDSTGESVTSSATTLSTAPSHTEPRNTPGPVPIDFSLLTAPVGCIPELAHSNNNRANVYLLDSLEKLETFFETYVPVSTLQYPSPLEDFFGIMNAEFFETKFVLLTYVELPSSSISCSISSIHYVANMLEVHVQCHNPSQELDADMAGYLLGACIDRKYLSLTNQYVATVERDIPETSYQLTVSDPDGLLMQDISSASGSHLPGTPLVFYTQILIDADIAMYVNGEFVCTGKEAEGTDYWVYYLDMPWENTTVEFQIQGGGPVN